jgi:mannonate dehydratase
MRLVLHAQDREQLRYAAQLGCDGVMSGLRPDEVSRGYYEYSRLVALKSMVESFGLSLEGLGMLPWGLCYKWMLGLPGRDEQIENLQRSIRNQGAAEIPMIVFNMHALRFYRTSHDARERGGARSSSFEWERAMDAPLMTGGSGTDTSNIPETHRHPISDEQMWDNYLYFLSAVVPVAEQAGVKLALHPDDPQVPVIGGVARIMRSPEAMRRALDVRPSDNLGLKFCVGCFSQMGADVAEEIRHFGGRRKIFLVDFRNVRGRVDEFRETFLDNGQEDMVEIMKAFVETGYEGPIGPDHAVHMSGDDRQGNRYWAYAIGYMRAILQCLEDQHQVA